MSQIKKAPTRRLRLPLYPFLSMLCEPFSNGRIDGELIGRDHGIWHDGYSFQLLRQRVVKVILDIPADLRKRWILHTTCSVGTYSLGNPSLYMCTFPPLLICHPTITLPRARVKLNATPLPTP